MDRPRSHWLLPAVALGHPIILIVHYPYPQKQKQQYEAFHGTLTYALNPRKGFHLQTLCFSHLLHPLPRRKNP